MRLFTTVLQCHRSLIPFARNRRVMEPTPSSPFYGLNLTDLSNVFDLRNLRRAYRWIMSNPDARYKFYFRDSYEAFAIASDTHIKWIRQEALKDRYQVSHASKILVPKPSGTLRSLTLLTVDYQIVYQAFVNVIAEILKRKLHRVVVWVILPILIDRLLLLLWLCCGHVGNASSQGAELRLTRFFA